MNLLNTNYSTDPLDIVILTSTELKTDRLMN